jgi:hypothetical protein
MTPCSGISMDEISASKRERERERENSHIGFELVVRTKSTCIGKVLASLRLLERKRSLTPGIFMGLGFRIRSGLRV